MLLMMHFFALGAVNFFGKKDIQLMLLKKSQMKRCEAKLLHFHALDIIRFCLVSG
jgi:hypothetical protein